jgi:tryptophan halogenase
LNKPVKKVVIAGGGTAGWMVAAGLSATFGRNIQVTLVESDEIGTVGVGEATVPSILTLHRLLKIKEPEFLKATNATFKLGIQFEGWKDTESQYFHSFGDTGSGCWAAGFQHFWLRGQREGLASDYGDYCLELQAARQNKFSLVSEQRMNYAYHLDAGLYGQYLRQISESRGVVRQEGKISHVNLDSLSGYITSILLDSGLTVDGDLFIDCTGFRALLLGEAMQVGYDDWSDLLPANRAYAVQTPAAREPVPYTRAIAHDCGWQWQIPLQNRVGNGLVFSDHFVSEQTALDTLISHLPVQPETEPRLIKFVTGQRQRYWQKNCIGIGLASGFIEPMESTSIHMIQSALMWLLLMFPRDGINSTVVEDYNQRIQREVLHIRDFIVLHYHVTQRRDSELWRYLSSMPIPDSLQNKLQQFKTSGQVFKPQDDFFAENSWIQVMMGQGLLPSSYHPIVDTMSSMELSQFLQTQKQYVQNGLEKLSPHVQFVRAYCQAK